MSVDILQITPKYCEYANGSCDQTFSATSKIYGLFLYPSDPIQIAGTIEAALKELKVSDSQRHWLSWRDLQITGQVIFCEICKALRFAEFAVADVTSLNRNLLFEIGFSVGLGKSVLPIRDTSFIRDKRMFTELGLLDTIGYIDFQNRLQLYEAIMRKAPGSPMPIPQTDINNEAPLYVIKGPLQTEGEVRLLSKLKKSALRFRTFDTAETPRRSLHEVQKQVFSSLGVVAHLLSKNREGAIVHNARCAFICGMAMATGKHVFMLQEDIEQQPIDYRDVVVGYTHPDQVSNLVDRTIMHVINWLQRSSVQPTPAPRGLLQNLDIGDVAAENEIRPLRSYFVETGQYSQAKRGHARLVVGRKGSGKTAIFYSIRDSLGRGHSRIVLDLKPEGHQFVRFREVILSKLSPGFQEHTLTGFWNLILLTELANKIAEDEYSWAHRDPQRLKNFENVIDLYQKCGFAEKGDFSERLLRLVERLAQRLKESGVADSSKEITQILFTGDIRDLNDSIAQYLEEKEEVWFLIDNLDKGWPTHGATTEDILILRTLLEATRKLQRQLEERDVNFHCLVFLRNDIYEHLLKETPDKGKDTPINLDEQDPKMFQEILRRRILASRMLNGDFETMWRTIVEPHVGTRHSFDYVLERTLMRPRDMLMFMHRAIEVAVNRGHDRILQDDLKYAERSYSEDMLQSTVFELKDTFQGVSDYIYVFLGCPIRMSVTQTLSLLASAGLDNNQVKEALSILTWFAFLGVYDPSNDETRYAYEMRYDLNKLESSINRGIGYYVVHPAFRSALECTDFL